MRASVSLALLLVAAGLALPLVGSAASPATYIPSSSLGSWGLGIVVPQSDGQQGIGGAQWESVSNVTAVVTLPEMVNVTATTYVIESVMLSDSTVLQVAAGLYRGERSWHISSMYIDDIREIPQFYHWVQNSSAPSLTGGESVALSIHYSESNGWMFTATKVGGDSRIEGSFGVGYGVKPLDRDQEIVALESYSSDAGSFSMMGRMTLQSITLDGQRAKGGWYVFGDWDFLHNPPFVVGGLAPPSFMGAGVALDGTATWYYAGSAANSQANASKTPVEIAASVLAGLGIGIVGTKGVMTVSPPAANARRNG